MTAALFRHAGAGDVDAVARLHAESWRQSYRGLYSDAFLDGDAVADRLAVWEKRLAGAEQGAFTIVAEVEDAVVGFIHVILDDDPAEGAVVQNLHVAPGFKRQGIGSGLMAEAAEILRDMRPSSGLAVWVREDNATALAFYKARGGTRSARKLGGPFADGGRAPVVRYQWPDPSVLLAPGKRPMS